MQIIKHFFCKFGEKNRTFLYRRCIGNNLDIIPMGKIEHFMNMQTEKIRFMQLNLHMSFFFTTFAPAKVCVTAHRLIVS